MNRIGKLVGLVGLALVAGCAVDPNEQTQHEEVTGSSEEGLTKGPVVPTNPPTTIGPSTPADSPTFVARSNAPAYQAMSAGDGWRMVNVSGVLNDSDTASAVAANEPVYIVDSIDKIDNAPLQASTKSAIKSKFTSKTGDARLGAIFVRKSIEDQIAALPKNTGTVSTFSGCSDTDRTYTKSFDYTKNFDYSNNGEAGHFAGSFGVNGYTRANASASVTITLDRVDLPILGCTTYWGHLKSAAVVGSAIVDASGKANGTFNAAWSKTYSITEPTIFDDWISIGGIPVWVKITLPIEAGIEANASIKADMDGRVIASGQFNVNCDSGDCTFDKSASFTFRPNQDAHLGVNARAKIIPSATASAKLAIYDSVATAKVGVKAGLVSDFWGYYGNTCGDANGDNVPEYVQAATLDESVDLSLVTDIRLFGSSLYNRSFNILTWHVGFFDLLPGHSTALDPIVTPKYGSPSVNVRMRPCYPYADPVNYQIDWMDGTALQPVTSAAAQTNMLVSHTYAAAGPRIGYKHAVTAKAVTDNAPHNGRTLNGSTVGKYDSTPVLVVSQ